MYSGEKMKRQEWLQKVKLGHIYHLINIQKCSHFCSLEETEGAICFNVLKQFLQNSKIIPPQTTLMTGITAPWWYLASLGAQFHEAESTSGTGSCNANWAPSNSTVKAGLWVSRWVFIVLYRCLHLVATGVKVIAPIKMQAHVPLAVILWPLPFSQCITAFSPTYPSPPPTVLTAQSGHTNSVFVFFFFSLIRPNRLDLHLLKMDQPESDVLAHTGIALCVFSKRPGTMHWVVTSSFKWVD